MSRKLVLVAAFAIIFVVIIAFNINCQLSEKMDAKSYPYQSAPQALDQGIAVESAGNIDPGNTKGLIVLQETKGNSIYVVVKIPYIESGRIKHFVFVGELRKKNGKFAFIRRSEDYGLNTTGDVDDGDYTPYNAYLIDDIDGLYFEVGKVFDKEVHPMMNSQIIILDTDNIFAVSQAGKRPVVKMVRDE